MTTLIQIPTDLRRIAEVRRTNPSNRMAKHFDTAYFATLSDADKAGLLQCCRSGIENPDSSMGCYAMQPADYDRFKPFFSKVSGKQKSAAVLLSYSLSCN